MISCSKLYKNLLIEVHFVRRETQKNRKTSSYVEPQKKGENREKKILVLEAHLGCCEPLRAVNRPYRPTSWGKLMGEERKLGPDPSAPSASLGAAGIPNIPSGAGGLELVAVRLRSPIYPGD